MTVLIDVIAVLVGWIAVGVLLMVVLDPRLLRKTAEGVVNIVAWPVVLFQIPSRRRTGRDYRHMAAIRGHNDVVRAVTSALRDVPETALLRRPIRARIAAAIDAAFDAAIDAAEDTGGKPRPEYAGAFLTACSVVDSVFDTAEIAEEEGEPVSMPFVGDLLRALPERSELTGLPS